MDDLKIIVYVIAAIIWMVARNYKKVQQTRPKIEPKTNAPSIETVKPAAIPLEKTPYQKMIRESVHDSYKSERLKSAVANPKVEKPKPKTTFSISRVLQTNEQDSVIKTETELAKEKFAFFEFDLRKAVLYSEILKRPAY